MHDDISKWCPKILWNNFRHIGPFLHFVFQIYVLNFNIYEKGEHWGLYRYIVVLFLIYYFNIKLYNLVFNWRNIQYPIRFLSINIPDDSVIISKLKQIDWTPCTAGALQSGLDTCCQNQFHSRRYNKLQRFLVII